jgi:parallel beta-helix repeat protein
VVQQNTFGLYLNSSGVHPSVVERNCFRLNNKPGSASGAGIYSDQGLTNAHVRENYFTGHNVGAIVLALNQRDITIEHNDMVDDAGTIVLVGTQNARVTYNHIVNTTSSGIFVGGGVSDAYIAYNLIDNPGGTGITTNVQFLMGANTLLVIEKNHIRSSPFDGIRLNQTDLSVVRGNKSQGNFRDGIRLQNDSDMNEVNNNLSRDNGRDGMRVDPGSSDTNTIEQNKMLGNVEHDCHDDTVGGGTGGTANLWMRNIGKTENRPGLCKNAM